VGSGAAVFGTANSVRCGFAFLVRRVVTFIVCGLVDRPKAREVRRDKMTRARCLFILAVASWLLLQPVVPSRAEGLPPADLSPVLLNVVNLSASPDDSRSPVLPRGQDRFTLCGRRMASCCTAGTPEAFGLRPAVAAGEQPSLAISADGAVHVAFVNEFGITLRSTTALERRFVEPPSQRVGDQWDLYCALIGTHRRERAASSLVG